MNSFDQFTIQFGFLVDQDAKLVLAIAIGVIVIVLVARFVVLLSQLGGGSTYDSNSYTPTVYQPPQISDEWYGQDTAMTDAKIQNIVKHQELRETQEWLARRNK